MWLKETVITKNDCPTLQNMEAKIRKSKRKFEENSI